VKYLLDSHAFYWLVHPGFVVPKRVAGAFNEEGVQVFVSAVSAFELATKRRLGKFEAPRLLDQWATAVAGLGAQALAVSTEHSLLAGRLDWPHRDPFDRLLVAQAIVDGLTLVTADRMVLTAPALSSLPW
jgi:PIN domain nuclease of toxin-antitoxin system